MGETASIDLGPEGIEEVVGLSMQLVNMLADEKGVEHPQSLEDAVTFLSNELKGFDSKEAEERREQARLDEILRILGRSRNS